MAIQYGTTIENLNLAIVKARTKKDGIYRFRGFSYRVRKGCITHTASSNEVLEMAGNFTVKIGECGGFGDHYDKIALQQIKK